MTIALKSCIRTILYDYLQMVMSVMFYFTHSLGLDLSIDICNSDFMFEFGFRLLKRKLC